MLIPYIAKIIEFKAIIGYIYKSFASFLLLFRFKIDRIILPEKPIIYFTNTT